MPDYAVDDFETMGRRLREIEAEARGTSLLRFDVRCEACGAPWQEVDGRPFRACYKCGHTTSLAITGAPPVVAPCA